MDVTAVRRPPRAAPKGNLLLAVDSHQLPGFSPGGRPDEQHLRLAVSRGDQQSQAIGRDDELEEAWSFDDGRFHAGFQLPGHEAVAAPAPEGRRLDVEDCVAVTRNLEARKADPGRKRHQSSDSPGLDIDSYQALALPRLECGNRHAFSVREPAEGGTQPAR